MSNRVSVLLISPSRSCRPDGNFGDAHLVCLGSYLQARTNARVEVIDLEFERRLPNPQPERLFDRDILVVGISCYSSYDYLSAYYLGREIRQRNPDVVLVTGGYHPSARPGDFLNLPDSELEERSPFDHVVVGEGELPLARIVAAAARGERLSEPVLGPDPIDDLNELPPLDWGLLDRYRPIARSVGGQFNVPVSRGCPYRCSFCMEAVKGESVWRAWSPDRAEQELLTLSRWLDPKGWKLFIADAVFGMKPVWRQEMLERLARLDLGFDTLWTLSRVDLFDPGDIQRYQRAGFGVGIGLESGDPDMLELTGKTRDADTFHKRCLDLARASAKAGLPWGANIIVGHPGETEESMRRSAEFTKRLFADTDGLTGFLSVDPFRFYPGTLIDRQRKYYEDRFGTRIHRPRWWNYSEPEFTAEWVDPSSSLDYRQRERLTVQLFEPVLEAIAKKYAYQGPARDYFRRSVDMAGELFQPPQRLRLLANYHLWRRMSGQSRTSLVEDPEAQSLFRQARRKTVADMSHIGGTAVPERIMAAVIDEPRERYVTEDNVLHSWQDSTIPLLKSGEATLSALHAYLINYTLLDLQEGDRLAEVGGGTGYGAAIAARIVGATGHVVTFEVISQLAELAAKNLVARDNVTVVSGDGLGPASLPEFNKVLFACALPTVPQHYLDALPENGRLVIPLLEEDSKDRQVLTRFTRIGGQVRVTRHGNVRYVRAVEASHRDDS